ncbi:type I restriction enzyme HsdR N-terminal domain-containing protein [Pedobacter sp. BS3]|uniref:type I restriction enzyme HsdR N-terminal domain-containing protein n=1 Tax=Pedobacter sp. BS3 TaxID=2567937 RepID=UPI0011ECB9C6|nr:type I restriction enzyme HsdR N-terminal domain-containing protein [Pedobacter sp. BS3]TZF81492.1 type I restriction enzyme HsdR N-terminal domain-containing protein [Pedobacter sp. BS3]
MFEPIALNLPAYPFRMKTENDKVFIFDELRKKYLVLTPEEWVRQHFINYLVLEKKYPKTLVQLEAGLKLNQLQKRTDVVVFNPHGQKILLVECKAPSVKITQKTFDQIARYNMVHKISLLAVTNGIQHIYCRIDFEKQTYQFLPDLPEYSR